MFKYTAFGVNKPNQVKHLYKFKTPNIRTNRYKIIFKNRNSYEMTQHMKKRENFRAKLSD